ncbi:MAG TPA: DUF6675 family protein [Spirochaetia bacterium]|nr:DUF6675 family protein [Spirochaetia bacterium]
MTKTSFATLVAFLLAVGIPAAVCGQQSEAGRPIEQIISNAPGLTEVEAGQLAETGKIVNTYANSLQTRLAPDFAGLDAVRNDLSQIHVVYGIEALYRVPVPAVIGSSPEKFQILYNIARSISTLKGIEYYSASRKRMRVFYLESYAISGPESRKAERDPLVNTIPAKSTVYAFQEDSSFGSYVMQIDYSAGSNLFSPDYVLMSLHNLTKMNYSIFPIIDLKHFHMNLAIILREDALYIYGNSGIDTFSFGFLKDHINQSFANRLTAVSDWFVARMRAKAQELTHS